MSDVEIDGQLYRCGTLPTRTQFHVVKRLLPVIQGLAPLFQQAQQRLVTDEDGITRPDLSRISAIDAVAALSNTIGMMSDADGDFILDSALSCVRWEQNGRWIPLYGPSGSLTNGSADNLATQLRLLWEVLSESLANFSFATLLPQQTQNGQDQMGMIQTR
ncbi:MAG TPA: hypothetical protein VGD41_18015 [Pyrinomonadaceae bacterium]